jgi:hypothetical protein
MLHTCAVRFDVPENLKKFTNFFRTKQALACPYNFDRKKYPLHPGIEDILRNLKQIIFEIW